MASSKHPKLHFGNWLRREIEDRLKTNKQFAEEAGLDESSLYRILREPSPCIRGVTIVRIAKSLGVSRDDVERQLGGKAASTAA